MRWVSIGLLIVGGLPLITYPIIAMASLMSLAGHTTGDEPVLLMMVVKCFLWGSLAYPLVYGVCVALVCRAFKQKQQPAAVGFSGIPLAYLLILAALMTAWQKLG